MTFEFVIKRKPLGLYPTFIKRRICFVYRILRLTTTFALHAHRTCEEFAIENTPSGVADTCIHANNKIVRKPRMLDDVLLNTCRDEELCL